MREGNELTKGEAICIIMIAFIVVLCLWVAGVVGA